MFLYKNVQFSVQTSITEIKPVVMEKHGFEDRVEALKVSPFCTFRIFMTLLQGCNLKVFLIRCSSSGVNFQTECLMELIKPVVFENFEFEKREKSKVLIFFQVWDDQKFDKWIETKVL